MARKKNWTNMSTDEKINSVMTEINELTIALRKKKTDLKKLTKQKQNEDSQRLLEVINSSGRTIDDVITMLQND